jgi:preprotein translocase subunit SecD
VLYFSKLKLVIIYFIIIFLSLFSFVNFIHVEENFVLSKKVNLGLDLQGGSYLLLEVDSQPSVDRNLQEKLLKLRKFLKKNKIKLIKMKLEKSANFNLKFLLYKLKSLGFSRIFVESGVGLTSNFLKSKQLKLINQFRFKKITC